MPVKRAKTSRRSGSATAKAGTGKRSAARESAAKPASKSARKSTAKSTSTTARPVTATVRKLKVVPDAVVKVVEGALDEMKAVNVKVLDVHKLTDIADTMIIASGNSDRHVRSIADRIIEHAKGAGFRPMGVEGERDGEWVLVDLQDVIVHIMLPRVREFYRLESLWDVSAARREAAERSA
jgi:ribosome-associated protein